MLRKLACDILNSQVQNSSPELPGVWKSCGASSPCKRPSPAARPRVNGLHDQPRLEGRRPRGSPRDPQIRLRLRPVPAAAGGGDRPCDRGRRRARAVSDREGQVALLPDPGTRPRGRRHRGVAAGGADAGPGDRPVPGRRPRRRPQRGRLFRGGRPHPGRRPGRRARPPLRNARAARPPRLHGLPLAGAGGALCDRRGALRQPVGSRLPPGIRRPRRPRRPLPRRAAHRADGDRRSPDAGGHPPLAPAGARGRLLVELRPAEHPLRDRGARPAAPPAPRLSRPPPGRERDRLLPQPQVGGGDGRIPERPRHPCAALPRRARPVRAGRQPGRFPEGGRAGAGGDRRLRNGHRQAGRALRRPPGPAVEHRGLLPGDGPRRTRRAAGRGLHDLRHDRRGAAPADDRRGPRPTR